jgi:predicted CopG family antitoxin
VIKKSSPGNLTFCSIPGMGVYHRNIYKVYRCIQKYMETTVRLNENVKRKLDLMKIHSRESYNDVIARVIGNHKKIDEESLRETIEVLSDPETMRDIAEALEDFERGGGIELRKLARELRLNV